MKLTKKLEAEVLKAYNAYWDAYLKGEMKTFGSMLDDNITVVGTAVSEVFNNKKETIRFYKATADQLVGKVQLRNREIDMKAVDDNILINEQFDLYFLTDGNWTFYGRMRVSAILIQTGKGWKLIHQHASFPDLRAEEGEQLAAEKIKAENLQLRDAVKRRTIELENKNHELEIESALERVRAVAMSMGKPEDLSGVGEIVFKELKGLGFTDLRNTEIIVINDSKETLTSYYYSDYGVTGVVEVLYKSNPKVKKWVKDLKKANDAFAEVVIHKKEIAAWRKYREEVGHKPDPKLNKAKEVFYYSYSIGSGGLSISTFKPASAEQIRILERFRNVFNLSYQRYIDIAQAEAQAREAQIEAALERVRARTMAMHNSQDVTAATETLFDELRKLGIDNLRCGIAHIHHNRTFDVFGTTSLPSNNTMSGFGLFGMDEHPVWQRWFESWKNKEDVFVAYIAGQEKEEYFRNINDHLNYLPQKIIQFPDSFFQAYYFEEGSVWTYSLSQHSEPEKQIMKRFASGFSLTFRRYQDLKKAEAQAREAEIELALERVRARTMAMQKPAEFNEVIDVIGEQFLNLGFDIQWANFSAKGLDVSDGLDMWMFAVVPGLFRSADRLFIPYAHHPIYTAIEEALKEYQTTGKDFFVFTFDKADKNNWLDHIHKTTTYKDLPTELKAQDYDKPGYTTSAVVLKDTWLSIGKHDNIPFNDEQNAILKKFSVAFGQAYTRFLDLQKAEAQAKEAQIEAGLERVRSRAMAMQTSEELNELIGTVFTELTKLDFVLTRCVILIYEGNEKGVRWWMANSEAPSTPMNFFVKYANLPFFNEYLKGWHERSLKWRYILEGEDKIRTDNVLFNETELSQLPDFVIAGMKANNRVYLSASFNNYGCLNLASLEPLSDEHFDILLRFAKVFDLTYTRFNDLKQAEAQAKESRIQLALERVRARTMAMQKSDELAEAAQLLYEEFRTLDIKTYLCGYLFFKEEQNKQTAWVTAPDGVLIPDFVDFPLEGDPVLDKRYADWKQKKPLHVLELKGEANKAHHRFLASKVADPIANEIFSTIPDRIIFYCANFSAGYLFIIATEFLTKEEEEIIIRFAKVFELTYTRFNDLKQAEAQAREAKIEAALERVRARAMAMHESQELKDVALELRNQMGAMAQRELEVCAIHLYEESPDYFDAWAAVRPPEDEGKIMQLQARFPKKGLKIVDEMMQQYHAGKKDYILINEGEKVPEWFAQLKEQVPKGYEMIIQSLKGTKPEDTRTYWSVADFQGGALVMTTYIPPNEDARKLLRRFSNVFGLAYRRFVDLKQAEAQARESELELALERVRAKSMSMRHSEELADLVKIVFKELNRIGFSVNGCIIMTYDERTNDSTWWIANFDGVSNPIGLVVPNHSHEPYLAYLKEWKKQTPKWSYKLGGDEKKKWDEYIFKNSGLAALPDGVKTGMQSVKDVHLNVCFNKYASITFGSLEPMGDKDFDTLHRFAKVFEQSYTRFLDLQNAEAQAREAQIEAALEKVRSRSLAMHKAEELGEVITVIFDKLKELNFSVADGVALITFIEGSRDLNEWMANPGFSSATRFYLPYFEHPVLSNLWNAKNRGTEFMEGRYTAEENRSFLNHIFEHSDYKHTPQEIKDFCLAADFYANSIAFQKHTAIFINDYTGHALSEHEIDILKRFSKVFEQTYIRFMDLQKAEAQAREARIETALEKIRSRSLAMHKSDELQEVVNTVFERLKDLEVEMDSANIAIFKEGTRDYDYWIASPVQKRSASFHMPYVDLSLTRDIVAAREKGIDFSTTTYSFEEKNEWFDYAFKNTDFRFLSEERKQFILNAPAITVAIAFSKHTGVQVNRYNNKLLTEGEAEIVKRFSKVFEQAYIRFLDLEKAEAQANEARIEIALERIRARALAMHKSDELMEVAKVMREQMALLGQAELEASAVHLYEEGSDHILSWRAVTIGSDAKRELTFGHMAIPKTSCEFVREWLTKFYSDLKEYTIELSGSKQQEWYDVLFTLAPEVINSMREKNSIHEKRYYRFSKFSGGALLMISKQEPSAEASYLQSRAAVVFDLAYRRFTDLQKAEAQARDAQIESSLERVRSKTMAMHNSQDVADTVATMFDELVKLGVETVRCGIGIMHEHNQMELWTARKSENEKVELIIGRLDMTIHPLLQGMYNGWKNKDTTFSYELKGNDLVDYFTKLVNSPDYHISYDIASLPQQQFQKGFFFPEGALFAFSAVPLSTEASQIFKRFAGVFGQTYRRYLDLQKAEAQAKEAKIEASLERVRAKAMAMHKSDDLLDAVKIMFEEFQKLNLNVLRCGIGILNKHSRTGAVWTASISDDGLAVQISANESFDIHPLMKLIYEYWQKQEDLEYDLQGQDLINYYRAMEASELKLPKSQLSFSDDELQPQYYYGTMFNAGGLYSFRDKPFAAEDKKLMKRFASVVNLTYNRFLDLQKAEAQAREAKIEASLERVRAKAMAMHKSEDLNAAVATVFEELDKLDLGVLRCGISILDKEKRTGDIWVTSITDQGSAVQVSGDESFDIHPLLQGAFEAWLKKEDFSYLLEGDDLTRYYKAVKAANFQLPESQLLTAETGLKKQYFFATQYGAGGLFAVRETEFPEEAKTVMKRFASVFDLTYKRFLDLQKAEANAREAQIEAGLERVRARTMAMHSSDDVSTATATMFIELEKLGIQNLRGGITIIRPDQTQEVWSITNLEDGTTLRAIGVFDMRLHPLWEALFKAKERKESYDYYWLAGKDKEDYIAILNATPNYLAQPIKEIPDVHVQSYFFAEGGVWTNSLQPHSEEDKQVMKRFTSVFSLTFRRYQDLKKAEAQARESQIEASLEKVRSRTMAMFKSDELADTAVVLFKQMIGLGIEPNRLYIAIINDTSGDLEFWITDENGDKVSSRYIVNINKNISIKKMYEGWAAKKKTITIDMQGKELEDWLTYWKEEFHVQFKPGAALKRRVQNIAYFSKGFIAIASPDDQPESTINLLEKFAAVFNLTYTRFSDLQQAEAQAREATIEAALERVRGKAMAMHSSKDLATTIGVFYHELEGLNLTPRRCGVGLIDKEKKTAEISTMNATADGKAIELVGVLDMTSHPVLQAVYNNWLTKTEYHPVLRGNEIKGYYQVIRPQINFPDYPNDSVQYGYFFFFEEGGVHAWTEKELNEDELNIYRRFTSVLSLTYKRYKDLKDAEARAQTAIKDAALDRIRADIASMRTINDLDRITPLIWNELTVLGIPFIRCGVFIMDEEQQLIHTFLSTPDGKAIAAFHLPYDTPGNVIHVLSSWKEKKNYIDRWDESEFKQFADILVKQGTLASAEQYLKTIPKGGFHLHFLPFLQGMLYVGNTSQLNEEQIELIQHVADAFSTAYARYEDFNKLEAAKQQVEKTLTDLKQAQTQLVQSEKMASLGELTAGIAHEIQNPLNFVNNFSDVSNELLEEMKTELEKGNSEDAMAIVEDIKQNLEKILHHGKRADAIVKGMLQHSRSSSGQKEPTDINVLAEEYLRLSFHGLRAKDKTFNAKFETKFDNSIGKINVIPQEIGRVILNLINNAFYAVTEKRKHASTGSAPNGYEPVVTVTTKKDNGRVEITVKDNGNGIPQKVLDKIFQPFFTTKPTGQGTGLGLSLSYDIVTKGHGGELKVETKEGEGSEFIIQIPVSKLPES